MVNISLEWSLFFLIIGFTLGKINFHHKLEKTSCRQLKKSWWKEYRLAIITGGITFFLFLIYHIYFYQIHNLPAGGPESWGDFGDFIGGLMNPVVGIFTIILLVRTLNKQQENAKEAANALTAQNKALQIQNFEQTLFKWLESYKNSLNEIATTKTDENNNELTITGLDAVKHIYQINVTIPKALHNYLLKKEPKSEKKWINICQDTIEETYQHVKRRVNRIHVLRKNANLTRSIRLIYGLLRWIDSSSNINEEQRQFYANIIRAHLSEDELVILFYYGLTPAGKKLVEYINKLAILDNLLGSNSSIIASILSNNSPYNDSAFGQGQPFALRIRKQRLRKLTPPPITVNSP